MQFEAKSEITVPGKYKFQARAPVLNYLNTIGAFIKDQLPDVRKIDGRFNKEFDLNRGKIFMHNDLYSLVLCLYRHIDTFDFARLTIRDLGKQKYMNNFFQFQPYPDIHSGLMLLELTSNTEDLLNAELNITGKPGSIISKVISFLNQPGSVRNLQQIREPKYVYSCPITQS